MQDPRPNRRRLRPRALIEGAGIRLGLALLLVAPAAAAAAEPAPGNGAVAAIGDPGARLVEEIEDPLRQAAKRKRERRLAKGPFHPVVGAADYGSAEAAFGNARGRPHEGQDVFAPAGTPVIAPAAGVVLESGSDGGRGNWVAIYDPERERTYNYFHLIGPATVGAGEKVEAGARVGRIGCTGSCWGDHLHFEIREGRDPYGAAIDPMPFLERARAYERR